MKPFARINLSSAALRRGILVSSLAFAAGCMSIERTGEYYVATKTMTFQKLDEYHREMDDSKYMPLPFSIGIPDESRKGIIYLPPSAGVMLFFAGFLSGDAWPITALVFAPAGAAVWAGESLVIAPVWDTLCLPRDVYLRDDYLEKERQKTDIIERSNP